MLRDVPRLSVRLRSPHHLAWRKDRRQYSQGAKRARGAAFGSVLLLYELPPFPLAEQFSSTQPCNVVAPKEKIQPPLFPLNSSAQETPDTPAAQALLNALPRMRCSRLRVRCTPGATKNMRLRSMASIVTIGLVDASSERRRRPPVLESESEGSLADGDGEGDGEGPPPIVNDA